MSRIVDNSAAFEDAVNERIRRFLTDAGLIVLRRAKVLCTRKTGELARSITMIVEGNSVRIGSNLPQAPIIELGAKPHIIRPNTKAALWWSGLDHPVKKVNHPGVKAVPYLRPALEASKSDIEAVAKREKLV